MLKPTKAALFGLHVRFVNSKPPSKLYKAWQDPRPKKAESDLQITDMANKHKLPLSMDEFRELQNRYYEDKTKKKGKHASVDNRNL